MMDGAAPSAAGSSKVQAPSDFKALMAADGGNFRRFLENARAAEDAFKKAQVARAAMDKRSRLWAFFNKKAIQKQDARVAECKKAFDAALLAMDTEAARVRGLWRYNITIRTYEPVQDKPLREVFSIDVGRKKETPAAPSVAPVPQPLQPQRVGFRLTRAPKNPQIEDLFEPRSFVPMDGFPVRQFDMDKIYLPVGEDRKAKAISLGAKIGPKGGIFITQDQVESPEQREAFGDLLPFYAMNEIEPLNLDLIPGSNWGASLANMLNKSSWDKLRQKAIAGTGGACRLCGIIPSNRSVDCHEIWSYHRHLEEVEGSVGVQRLDAILPLCVDCHAIFHLGRANANGRGETMIKRAALVNRWTDREMRRYAQYLEEKWLSRSQRYWALDFSRFRDDNLTLVTRRTGLSAPDPKGVEIGFKNDNAEGTTWIFGISFTGPDGITRPATPLDEDLATHYRHDD